MSALRGPRSGRATGRAWPDSPSTDRPRYSRPSHENCTRIAPHALRRVVPCCGRSLRRIRRREARSAASARGRRGGQGFGAGRVRRELVRGLQDPGHDNAEGPDLRTGGTRVQGGQGGRRPLRPQRRPRERLRRAAEERHSRDRDPLAAPRGALRDPCRRARRRPQDGRGGHPLVLQARSSIRQARNLKPRPWRAPSSPRDSDCCWSQRRSRLPSWPTRDGRRISPPPSSAGSEPKQSTAGLASAVR
uniref:Uncharacterized protein n=1 Tax=uncultured bacterium fosmid pJB190D12_contig II TaxID=1478060 RepID=A0A0H3U7F0_9BACT|nr:hypothetical protein [uncultured bacterium fosmid pJB190D12_contig II]